MNKQDLIAALERNRDELFGAIAGLSEGELTMIPVIEAWTVKDMLGHISYWEQVIHAHVRESHSEGKPRPQKPGETDEVVNPREAAKRKKWPWVRVRAEYENTRRALIERVQSLSETDLLFQVPSPWLNENRFYSVAQMIEEDALGHCREHTEQIRAWREKNRAA